MTAKCELPENGCVGPWNVDLTNTISLTKS